MGKGAWPIRHVVAGINREGAGSSGVKGSHMPRSEGQEYAEETVMCLTLNTVLAWWNRVMRVALVLMVLLVSACTVPGHSLPNPPAHSADRGDTGPLTSGDGDGGSGM